MITLDHLVLAAHTLEQGMAYVDDVLGAQPMGGGQHVAIGTHNRVLRLGERQYLEVIAIDPNGVQPALPRWFNLDDPALQAQLRLRPRLLTWVARSTAVRIDSGALPVPVDIRPMSRGDFSWQFGFTADGGLIGDGLIPHLIEWDNSGHHPADGMTDTGLRLVGLRGFHSAPETISRTIKALGLAQQFVVRRTSPLQEAGLQAMIQTPRDVVILE